MAASTGFLLASYSTKEFALTHRAPYPDDMLARLKRRDLRLFMLFCGGLVGYPYYAIVVMRLLTHGVVVGILNQRLETAGMGTWRDARPSGRRCCTNPEA